MRSPAHPPPRRLAALALLSERQEVLLCRHRENESYTLPWVAMAQEGGEDAQRAALDRLLTTLVTAPSDVGNALWLGRFALPYPDGSRVDMLELHAARLEGARLVAGPDAPRAWASLTAPAPAGRIDPTIALHIMPVLAALAGAATGE